MMNPDHGPKLVNSIYSFVHLHSSGPVEAVALVTQNMSMS